MNTRPYSCPICGWQGQLEPSFPDDDAPCPECGQLLYPLTWMQTWGVAALWVGVVVGLMGLVVLMRS